MAQVTWSTTALAAFSDVYRAVEERSPAAAAKLEDEALLARLASFPESGRPARDLDDPLLREAVIAPYVVLYLLRGDSVVILAFTYGVATDSGNDELHEAPAQYGRQRTDTPSI